MRARWGSSCWSAKLELGACLLDQKVPQPLLVGQVVGKLGRGAQLAVHIVLAVGSNDGWEGPKHVGHGGSPNSQWCSLLSGGTSPS